MGSGVNHIGFSFPDLAAKMAGWQAAGLDIENPDEPIRDVPNLFKLAFLTDPWGTRIEVVEDTEYLGFHHIHLSSPDPDGALAWYQNIFGGESDQLKGRINGLRYGTTWLLVSRLREGTPAATQGRFGLWALGFGARRYLRLARVLRVVFRLGRGAEAASSRAPSATLRW